MKAMWCALTVALCCCAANEAPEPEEQVRLLLRIALDSSRFTLPIAGARYVRADTVLLLTNTPPTLTMLRPHGEAVTTVLPSGLYFLAEAGVRGHVTWITDAGARQVHARFDAAGAWAMSPVPTVQPGAVTNTIGVLTDSSIVSTSRPFDIEGDTLVSLIVHHRGTAAQVVDSLVEVGSEMRLNAGDGGIGAVLGQPWAYRDMAALDRDEDVLMVLRQVPAKTGDGLVQVIVGRRRLLDDGVSSVTMYLRTARLSKDDVQRWLAGVIDSTFAARFGGQASAEAAIRARLYTPLAVPAVRRFISGSRGTLFLERSSSDGQHHWEHRTAAGTLIGAFRLPREWILQDAADTTIVAIRRTVGACDTLVTASLQRPRGRPKT